MPDDSPTPDVAAPEPAPAPSPEPAPAEPAASPAAPEGQKDTLLSHVFSAVGAEKLPVDGPVVGEASDGEPPAPATDIAPSPQPGQPPVAVPQVPEPELPDDLTPEEVKALEHPSRFKVRKRIDKLLDQRNDAWGRLKSLDFVETAMAQHRLQKDDVEVVLGLATLLNQGRFEDFLSGVQPYVELAAQYTGRMLPPDLQQEVRAGRLSPQHASELQARRMQGQYNEAMLNRAREEYVRDQTVQHAGKLRDSVNAWEANTRKLDPDYERKAPTIRQVVRGMIAQRGIPDDEAGALAMAKEAYDHVTSLVPQPSRRATLPAPNGSAGPSTAKREPKTMMEAVLASLQ